MPVLGSHNFQYQQIHFMMPKMWLSNSCDKDTYTHTFHSLTIQNYITALTQPLRWKFSKL